MKKIGFLIIAIISLLAADAQKQKTSIVKSWRDPETMIKVGQFNRILVVAFVKDPANRKAAEDDIVKQLKSKGVPSYQIFGEGVSDMDDEALAEKIKNERFDGAVVMQLINPDKEMQYTPGTGTYPATYNSFYPYYGGAAKKFSDPEYLAKHDIYTIETNFYSFKDNKLVWSGITNSVDPKDIDKMIASIGKVITEEMKKQGFLF
jgi:hypothetical protein